MHTEKSIFRFLQSLFSYLKISKQIFTKKDFDSDDGREFSLREWASFP